MLLTTEEMIKVVRESVNVQYKEEGVVDPVYLAMDDSDLELFLKLAVSRAYPSATSLFDLPEGAEYPIVLLTKIELYTKLAVSRADKVDMGADNNNYIKLDQRFQHYMKLVSYAKDLYDSWLENEGQGEVTSFEVLLERRHFSSRNYDRQKTPKVSLRLDSVTTDTMEITWGVSFSTLFGRYIVYLSDSTIVDLYKEGAMYQDKVVGGVLLLRTSNIRNTHCRIRGLQPDTEYHIAVIEVERNQVFGFCEKVFKTLPELPPEEDEDFNGDVVDPDNPDNPLEPTNPEESGGNEDGEDQPIEGGEETPSIPEPETPPEGNESGETPPIEEQEENDG